MDRMLCKSDGRHIDDKGDPVVLSRSAADHPHQGISLFFQIREIVLSREFRALLLLPGVKKELLEFSHRRAFNLNVGVTPGQRLSFYFSPSGKTA